MSVFLAAALTLAVTSVQHGIPNRQPIVAASGRAIYVVFGSGDSIWLTQSHDGGHTFGMPSKVAGVPGMALGRHRGPRVALSGEAIVVSALYGGSTPAVTSGPDAPATGDLLCWRSTDGGRSWSTPVKLNDIGGSAREGLHAMAADPAGNIAAVWLDLRAGGTQLYGAYSRDHGASWSKNVLLYRAKDGTICQCCHPSLAAAKPERFAVMFRNVVGGSRDLYVEDWGLKSGTTSAQRLGLGSWTIDACPMDGGGIGVAGHRTVSAWRRGETIYEAERGQAELALGTGKNVALALTQRGAYVAWTSPQGIQLKRPDGTKPVALSGAGDFPSLAPLPDGSVAVAWEEGGEIKLQVVR